VILGTHDVPLSSFASNWTLAAGPIAAALLGLALFAQAFLRLRRRGRADHAPWSRAALFGAGVGISLFPLVSPIDTLSDRYLLSVHMCEHLMLGDAGPALMVCAVRGPLSVFLVPPYLLGPLARTGWLRRAVAFLVRPRVSLIVWVSAMGCWHIPAAYDYTLTHQSVHDLEHLTFAIAGVLIWMQLIDPMRHGRLRVPQRLLFALVVFSLGQLLSDVLIFTFHPLYPSYADQPARVMGISPLLDQRLAGLAMMLEQAVTLGTCAVVLARRTPRLTPAPPEGIA
jgi:cytochrome c oxidase assembly factor CtaG